MLDTVNKATAATNSNTGWAVTNSLAGDQTWNGALWTGTAGTGYAHVCNKCHAAYVYQNSTQGRFDHTDDSSRTLVTMTSPMGIICFNCHGGFSTNAPGGLGAIHGTNETYTAGLGGTAPGTSRRYRFMSGSVMRYYKPVTDATAMADPGSWIGASTVGSCYTINANDIWATGCTEHYGANATDMSNSTLNYTKPLDW
jgi:hypothetical protein